VSEGEHHGLRQEHSARLLVDGRGDDVAVDRQATPTARLDQSRVQLHLDRGVLRRQEGAQVLIEDKHHLHLACRDTETGERQRETERERERERERQERQDERERKIGREGR